MSAPMLGTLGFGTMVIVVGISAGLHLAEGKLWRFAADFLLTISSLLAFSAFILQWIGTQYL